jgi:hypothetical protein
LLGPQTDAVAHGEDSPEELPGPPRLSGRGEGVGVPEGARDERGFIAVQAAHLVVEPAAA